MFDFKNAVPQALRKYVNAYLDKNGEVVKLYRDRAGALRQERARAEYVFYTRDVLPPDLERALKKSARVIDLRREVVNGSAWVRIAMADEGARRALVYDRKSPFRERGIEVYEGDVHPIRRWLTDAAPPIAKPRLAFLDIETDSRCNFVEAKEEGKARVLSWGLGEVVESLAHVDGKTEKIVACGVLDEETDGDERRLLDELFAAMLPYDQIAAWSGDDFDYPVIMARAEEVGCQGVDARRWLLLDHLKAFERMNKHSAESGEEKRSMKLDDIGQAVVQEGKQREVGLVEGKSLGAQTWDMWAAGGEMRRRMVRYMLQDIKLLMKIERKTGYIALFSTVCEVCHLFGSSESLNPTRQVDGFLLRLGLERGHHFPTKRYQQVEEDDQFEGAYVLAPRTIPNVDKDEPEKNWSKEQAAAWRARAGMLNGIATDVHVCDFSSMYPANILTWNMSAETKVEGAPETGPIAPGTCRAPATGIVFRTDKPGILAVAVKELIRLRKFWSEKQNEFAPGTEEWWDAFRRSTAYKVEANSFYGVVGSKFSRYYDREIAESVTQNGVWLIKKTIMEAERRGWLVLYSDTDSVFVMGATYEEFKAFVEWCNKELYPSMLLRQGVAANDNHVKLAFEKTFKRVVFTSAKRYAGSYSQYKGKPAKADSAPEIKGLEFKRGDAPLLAAQLQARVIDLLVGNVKRRLPDGTKADWNPGLATPTDELERYHTALMEIRDLVLKGDLPLEQIRISKSISKPLDEYAVKDKKDGSAGTDLAHVRVGKILRSRGENVSKGTRVEYVVTDGSVSPMKVIPAVDYKPGDVDLFYLWDTLIFPPTERLLESAYPDHDWASWGKVRPPKVRAPRKGRKVPEGQMSFDEKPSNRFEGPPPEAVAVPMRARRTGDYVIRIDAAQLPGGADGLHAVKAILEQHPGTRPVKLHVRIETGEVAVLSLPDVRVSGSAALHAALAPYRARQSAAA